MTTLRRVGLLVSVAATIAMLSAPAAFAEDGHGGHNNGGRHGDDHAVGVQNTTTPSVDDDRDVDNNEDVNEDNDDRDEVQVAPVMDNHQEVNELAEDD